MPSFDVVSEIEWQSMDDAINQTNKEIINRYDFKGLKVEIDLDQKEKTVRIFCSDSHKMSAVKDVFHQKLVKRGIPLIAIDYGNEEKATGMGARVVAKVAAGISKEKGKEVVALIKKEMKKIQAQIHDEKVRVTGKSRDELQETIALLKNNQEKLGVPLQFNNFRD